MLKKNASGTVSLQEFLEFADRCIVGKPDWRLERVEEPENRGVYERLTEKRGGKEGKSNRLHQWKQFLELVGLYHAIVYLQDHGITIDSISRVIVKEKGISLHDFVLFVCQKQIMVEITEAMNQAEREYDEEWERFKSIGVARTILLFDPDIIDYTKTMGGWPKLRNLLIFRQLVELAAHKETSKALFDELLRNKNIKLDTKQRLQREVLNKSLSEIFQDTYNASIEEVLKKPNFDNSKSLYIYLKQIFENEKFYDAIQPILDCYHKTPICEYCVFKEVYDLCPANHDFNTYLKVFRDRYQQKFKQSVEEDVSCLPDNANDLRKPWLALYQYLKKHGEDGCIRYQVLNYCLCEDIELFISSHITQQYPEYAKFVKDYSVGNEPEEKLKSLCKARIQGKMSNEYHDFPSKMLVVYVSSTGFLHGCKEVNASYCGALDDLAAIEQSANGNTANFDTVLIASESLTCAAEKKDGTWQITKGDVDNYRISCWEEELWGLFRNREHLPNWKTDSVDFFLQRLPEMDAILQNGNEENNKRIFGLLIGLYHNLDNFLANISEKLLKLIRHFHTQYCGFLKDRPLSKNQTIIGEIKDALVIHGESYEKMKNWAIYRDYMRDNEDRNPSNLIPEGNAYNVISNNMFLYWKILETLIGLAGQDSTHKPFLTQALDDVRAIIQVLLAK